ncbi:MAG TPA: molybdopterin-binding protein [Candidatus Limnocylindrales bacterium]|nr:molybdopterin-binding protein [Candidatus Limnocylindrales bacterium]
MASLRPILRAELLAVGSELTTGDTRDTNGGELARELTDLGVEVTRLVALPDDLAAVTEAIRAALGRADLVVTTGGLGPTPDDLTREAIAAAVGREPSVDPVLESALRGLFERRSMAMPEANRKQAWLVDGATSLANPLGTAPGWWVEADEGRVIVALPGPPREMRPMWRDEVLPRLRERGLGAQRALAVLRLAGIGESAVAELVGDALLRAESPQVATYVRPDSVDLRIAAGGPNAAATVAAVVAELEPRLASYLFARDGEGWIEALGRRLDGRRLAAVEIGTGGALAAMLGEAPWLARIESVGAGGGRSSAPHVSTEAERMRNLAGSEVGLAVSAAERRGDTSVSIAIARPGSLHRARRVAFLGGPDGRRRAAVLACVELWRLLGGVPSVTS